MRKVKVTLNERELEIQELRARANAAWLKKLEGPLREVVGIVAGATTTDLDDTGAVGGVLEAAAEVLAGSFDTILELLKEYAPEHAEDVEQCYSSEAVAAFVEVVKLALPFGEVGKLMAQLRSIG